MVTVTCLLPLGLLLVLRFHNADGNKLMIFSGIAWYYSDACIVCILPTINLNGFLAFPGVIVRVHTVGTRPFLSYMAWVQS